MFPAIRAKAHYEHSVPGDFKTVFLGHRAQMRSSSGLWNSMRRLQRWQ